MESLELRAMLNPPPHTEERYGSHLHHRQSPFDLLKEFHACIKQIRSLPRFGKFMMGPSIENMKAAATGGTIVVVNVSAFRSDAIVVTQDRIRSICLKDLDEARARRWLEEIRTWSLESQGLAHFGKQNSRYRTFLLWLWKSCVKVVFDELEYCTRPSSDGLPRIWWIGAGIASSLPFHAAGRHREGSRSSTLSIAVSSYVPTIRALIHAKSRALDRPAGLQHPRSLLVASMETTPGQPDLRGALAESNAITEIMSGSCRVTHRGQPSTDTILRLMSSHDMFHFAGHGESDPMDPAQSCLVFEKAEKMESPAVQDRLPVQRLFEVNLQPALLAFLSACSTAENKNERLADESIHLGSGFLVAGYRHVIGCLWPSNDQVCIDIAGEFYREMNFAKQQYIDDAAFARALHVAVGKVYTTLRDQPLLWAPYIHIGA